MARDQGESELIDQLRKRQPEALAKIYDRYGQSSFGLFFRVTRDQSAAEDLVQELFLRIWNRARDFDSEKGALGVWIISIARNMAIDYVRSAQARFSKRLHSIDQVDQLVVSSKPRESESFLDGLRAIKGAFSNLNANERRVVELAYFEGLSQSEIAGRLEEPLGTVKSWMRSALGRLRTAVKGGALR